MDWLLGVLMRLRGNRFGIEHSPKEVLRKIAAVAVQSGLHGGLRVYVCQGGGRIESLDGFICIAKIGYRFLKYFSIPFFYLSSCGAKEIVVKNNVIAFYPDQGFVVKLYGSEEAYVRHINGMAYFKACRLASVQAPDVAMSSTKPVCHVVESMRHGRTLGRPLELSDCQVKDLAKFHMTLARVVICDFSIGFIASEIEALFGAFGAREKRLIDAILSRPMYASVYGATHGDLTAGNMFLESSAIVLFDWEGYGEGSVATDLLKIWLQSSFVTRERIVSEYNYAQKMYFPAEVTSAQPDCMQLSLLTAMLISLADTNKLYEYLLLRDGSSENARKGVFKHQAVVLEGVRYLCGQWDEYAWGSEQFISQHSLSVDMIESA